MAAGSIRASKAFLEIVGRENVAPAINKARALVLGFASRVKALGTGALSAVLPNAATRAAAESVRQTARRASRQAASSPAARGLEEGTKVMTELAGSVVAVGRAGRIAAGAMRGMADVASRVASASIAFQEAFEKVVAPMRAMVTEIRRLGSIVNRIGGSVASSRTAVPPPVPPPPVPAAAAAVATAVAPRDAATDIDRTAKATRDLGGAMSALRSGLGATGSGLERAGSLVRSLGGEFRWLGLSAKLAGAATLGLVAGGIKSFVTNGSAVYDITQRIGISAEAWSELSLYAKQAGVDLSALELTLRTMQDAVIRAAAGSAEAGSALGAIGISASELLGLAPENQLERIADGLASIADPALRTSIALDLFGRQGTKLLPLLTGGAAGIRAARDAARELGVTVSSVDAAAADELGDAFEALAAVGRKAFSAIGASIRPVVRQAVDLSTNALKGLAPWIKANGSLVLSAVGVGAALVTIGTGLFLIAPLVTATGAAVGLLGAALGGLASIAGAVGSAVAFVGLNIGAVAAAATAAAGAALALGIEWRSIGNVIASSAIAGFGALRSTVTSAVAGIRAALSAGDAKAAAEVFWKAIELASLQGKDTIMTAWEGLIAELPTSWDQMVLKMAAALTVIEGKLRSIREEAVSALSAYFTEIGQDPSYLIDGLGPGGQAAGQAIRAARAAATKPGQLSDADRSANAANVIGAAGDTSAKSIEEIAREIQARLDAIRAEFAASKQGETEQADAARKERAEAIRKAAAALEAATRAAEASGRAADFGRMMDGWLKGIDGAGGGPPVLGRLQSAVEESASSVGTFSGAAARGLGLGVVERIGKSAEKAAANTDRLADILRVLNNLDFGLGEG